LNIPELEDKLRLAKERLQKCGTDFAAYWAAFETVVAAERELAAAKGEEYAVPLDFPVKWDKGAPLPHLFMSDYRTFLIFDIHVPDPNWDGTYITIKHRSDSSAMALALVEFKRCICAKMGSPNDEVFKGHRLNGRGQEPYAAQIVENSIWIAELEAINKVHSNYHPDVWRNLKHYIFWFHDSTFECVAETYTLEVFHESRAALFAEVMNRFMT
jgi:hypothetical protein